MPYWPHSDPEPPNADGQRPCARGDRCVNAERTTGPDGTRQFVGALGPRPFCDDDRAYVLRCIEDLPGHFAELGERIGDKGTAAGPKVSGSRSAPIPVNLTVDELRVETLNVVAHWATRVAVVARLTPPAVDRTLADRARYGAPLTAHPQQPFFRMCGTLAAHLDTLLGLPAEPAVRTVPIGQADDAPDGTPVRRHYDAGYAEVTLGLSGADAGLELIRLTGRARWVLGHTGKDERLAGRCFECEQLDVLVRPDQSTGLADHAECTACGARYYDAEYKMLMRAAYEEEIHRQQLNREAS